MEKMYIEWSFFSETNEDMLICYRRKMKVFFSIPCRGFGTYYVDERLCGRRNLERIFYSTKKGSQQYLVTRTKYARVILVIANDHMPERSWSFEDIKSDKKAISVFMRGQNVRSLYTGTLFASDEECPGWRKITATRVGAIC